MARLFGVHTVTLKEGVTAAEFEAFVANDWKSAKFPGIKTYFIKGDRGNLNGTYCRVYEMDQATRDRYFPTTAGATPEALAMFEQATSTPEQKRIAERYQALVVPPADLQANYTDWVVLGE